MKVGDLIWQQRRPGGFCVLLKIVDEPLPGTNTNGWSELDYPILKVLHPTEGVIEDPSYYYATIEESEKYGRRRLRYELEKNGEEVPEWLQKEIEKDENR